MHNGAKSVRARRLPAGSALSREDSDDELGVEDHPWEWMFEPCEVHATAQNEPEDGLGKQDGLEGVPSTKRRASKPIRAASRLPDQRIIGARMGNFECKLGECVLLKAEGDGSKAWVGILCEFGDDENGEMSANVMCK